LSLYFNKETLKEVLPKSSNQLADKTKYEKSALMAACFFKFGNLAKSLYCFPDVS